MEKKDINWLLNQLADLKMREGSSVPVYIETETQRITLMIVVESIEEIQNV